MSGPWIQTAVICETVTELEGKLVANDIVDGVLIDGGAPVSLNLVLALVRGEW